MPFWPLFSIALLPLAVLLLLWARRRAVHRATIRLSEEAIDALGDAAREAHLLQERAIRPEHFLLGVLAHGDGSHGAVLREAGLTDAELRARVGERPGRGKSQPGIGIQRLIEAGVEIAASFGERRVDVEHLLLASLELPSDVLEQLFAAHDLERRVVALRLRAAALDAEGPAG